MDKATTTSVIEYLLSIREFCYALNHRAFSEEPTLEFLDVLLSNKTYDRLLLSGTDSKALENLREYLISYASQDREQLLSDLRDDYTYFFIGPRKLPAPPWESVYTTGKDVLFQKETIDVRNAYRVEGYLPADYPKVADDHIAIEASFVQKLAEKSKVAFVSGDAVECLRLLDAQKSFLDLHLSRWLPVFAKRLQENSRLRRFYPDMATHFSEFVVWDMKTIDELTEYLHDG